MSEFQIAAAQIASVRGDIDANLRTHAATASSAAERGISVLVFPELSLTGYELDLADDLAITGADERLTPLASLAREHRMEIVVGAPLRIGPAKPGLGAVLLGADGSRRTYCKMHLGGTEPSYFAPGSSPLSFTAGGQTIGIAICADSSRPSHPQGYADGGCSIYATGVFLNAEWYGTDTPRLAEYASRFRMLVVMANHAASIGTLVSVGRSAAWAPGEGVLAQAAGTESCLVIAARSGAAWRGEVAPI